MKTKILMFAVLMGMSSVLVAQPKENEEKKSPRGPQHEMRMDDERGPMNGLNLTDAQKEAFKQSMLTMQKQVQPIRNELGEAEAHQKSLMTAEKPDLATINKNIEKIGELKTQIAKLQVKHRLDMRAQLTDEQRLKFDAGKDHMREGKGPKGMKHEMRIDHRMN
jgi:Spy/CpxP family protein refolding chaperone